MRPIWSRLPRSMRRRGIVGLGAVHPCDRHRGPCPHGGAGSRHRPPRRTHQRPVLAGTAEPGTTVVVSEDGRTLGTAPTDAGGAWSFGPQAASSAGSLASPPNLTDDPLQAQRTVELLHSLPPQRQPQAEPSGGRVPAVPVVLHRVQVFPGELARPVQPLDAGDDALRPAGAGFRPREHTFARPEAGHRPHPRLVHARKRGRGRRRPADGLHRAPCLRVVPASRRCTPLPEPFPSSFRPTLPLASPRAAWRPDTGCPRATMTACAAGSRAAACLRRPRVGLRSVLPAVIRRRLDAQRACTS